MTTEQYIIRDKLEAKYGIGCVKTSYPGPMSFHAVIFSCINEDDELVHATRVLPDGTETDPGPWLDIPDFDLQDRLKSS